MDYKLRRLQPDDYDDMLALWQVCELPCRPNGRDSRAAITSEMKRTETAFIGLFDDSRLIAIVLATSDGRKGWINRLAVHPDYQRQGLGRRLIKESEDFFAELGIKVIACLIEGDNQASFATFAKAGYHYHEDIRYYSKRSSPED
jgi:ribosomal protein S18 acetylase RimI-like enzyme